MRRLREAARLRRASARRGVCEIGPETHLLEASLALRRRYWSHNEEIILIAQTNVASCLDNLGRHEQALVLKRGVFARRVATLGLSHERTISVGTNLLVSLHRLKEFGEATAFSRDQLLPAARRSLGADHNATLRINQYLARALYFDPESTRDDLRFNQLRRGVDAIRFHLNTGDDLLEAETLMEDVVQRRRRVFGHAHPSVETFLSEVHAKLASRSGAVA